MRLCESHGLRVRFDTHHHDISRNVLAAFPPPNPPDFGHPWNIASQTLREVHPMYLAYLESL
jgi:hypothetical protein